MDWVSDRHSAAPEGAASRDWTWASAVNAKHSAAELRKSKTAARQFKLGPKGGRTPEAADGAGRRAPRIPPAMAGVAGGEKSVSRNRQSIGQDIAAAIDSSGLAHRKKYLCSWMHWARTLCLEPSAPQELDLHPTGRLLPRFRPVRNGGPRSCPPALGPFCRALAEGN